MRPRSILIALVVLVAALVVTTAVNTHGPLADSGRAFSAVPLHPDAAKELKAKGKELKFPFPNAVNQGRKFSPGGELVGQLSTNPVQKVLVLFVTFQTVPPGGPATRLNLGDYYDAMLFGTTYDPPEYGSTGFAYPTDRTLKNYYNAVSYGAVDIVTLNMPSAQGWTEVPHPYDYYCRADGSHDNGFGTFPENAQGIVNDAVIAADDVVDFSEYAIDGVVPNLFVVVAGTGAEWSGDPSLIWSHSWSLPGTGLTRDGVKIDSYAMMPEVGGNLTGYYNTTPTGPYPPTVGVYAHEYGHVLGLPDQYDYGYESDGTGIYSLMAGGSWNRYPYRADDEGHTAATRIFSGNSPSFLDAWSRYRLGFVTPTEITSLTSITVQPAENLANDDTVYKMAVPFSGGKEYFLLENRQNIGFDQGLLLYGTYKAPLGPHGLAIYHIDDVVLSQNYWRPNEAENWKEFRSEGWKKAWTGERHYGISIIQADDRWDLEHYYYGAFQGDLYPGTGLVTSFGNFTAPNSSSYYFWAGSAPTFGYSGVTVEQIAETAQVISATASFKPAK